MSFKRITPYFFLLPAFLFVGIFLIYPAIRTFCVGFQSWNGINSPTWIGLKNYQFIFRDPAFWISMKNTIIWVVGSLVFPVTVGFFLALLLFSIPFDQLFKVLFFLPYALSGVVISIVWSYMYSLNGAINTILSFFIEAKELQAWLQIVPLNTYAMILTYGWRVTGTNMVLFSVGMQAIPSEPIEAAYIEGASYWQTVRRVILPSLASTTAVVVVMSIINSLNLFDLIWVMTKGGPYRSSATLGVNVYFESFLLFNFGRGAANATILSFIVFISAIFYMKVIFNKKTIGE